MAIILIDDDEWRRLDECAREPIRIPGSIQPHGALLAFDTATLTVTHASENAAEFFGVDASELLGRHVSLATGEQWATEHTHVLTGAIPPRNPTPATINGRRLDVILHRTGALTIAEFEPSIVASDYQSSPAVYGAIRRLAEATSDTELWSMVARELRELTLFDRVMVYHFHPDGHGEIVAEERADDMEPYLGLHWPASDIPAQARELYVKKTSRMIVSSAGDTSALLAAAGADAAIATPLDLSDAELRAVSPYHLQFMRNMGQASTLSLSLIRENALIGMITLASRRPHHIPYLLRQGLEVLATQVALQLGSLIQIRRLTAQMGSSSIRAQLVGQLNARRATQLDDIAVALFEGDLTVLDLVPAEGCVLHVGGKTASTGSVPLPADVAAAALLARSLVPGGKVVADSLPEQYPELAQLLPHATGLLLIPLGGGSDFIAWFRPELVTEVRWLGDQSAENRPTTLSPRTSFSSWTQSVSGKAQPWGDLDVVAEELGRDVGAAMLRHTEAKLAALAMHDALTGLPNRRQFMDSLERARSDYERGPEMIILFIDLDSFKAVNDTFGHDAGDMLLVYAAKQIRAAIRTQDIVARLGGDEFVVLCQDATSEEAALIADRIVDAVRQPTTAGGVTLNVTASVGIATGSYELSGSELLQNADKAMYRAKSHGRDRTSR